MPIAVPMIPASASGVSITRSAPNSSYRPLVARNTPPNLPTSSPRTTTRGAARICVCSALRTASMMFIVGLCDYLAVVMRVLGPRLRREVGLLLAQVPRRMLVDIVEQAVERGRGLVAGRRERIGDLLVVLLLQLALPGLGPQAAVAQ